MLQSKQSNRIGCWQRYKATVVVIVVAVAVTPVVVLSKIMIVVVVIDDVHQTEVGLKLIVGIRFLLHADRFSQIRVRI